MKEREERARVRERKRERGRERAEDEEACYADPIIILGEPSCYILLVTEGNERRAAIRFCPAAVSLFRFHGEDKQTFIAFIKNVYSRMPQAMPETAISLKSPYSQSASANSKEESYRFSVKKRLTRCMRHKFQSYSQLPVRCQRPSPYYRPPRASLRLAGLGTINCTTTISTAKSCPENATCGSMFRVIGTPPCKKSLSLIDLSQSVMEIENGDFRSGSSSIMEKFDEGDKVYAGNDTIIGVGIKTWMDSFSSSESEGRGSQFFKNPKKAAGLVFHVLLMNAWRRRRDEVFYLRETIDDFGQQIKHLHLQIFVLRRLIDTENNRVGKLTHEVHRVKGQLDETIKERDSLHTENEKMKSDMKSLSEVSENRLVTAENMRNELFTVRSQIQALDEQISRDREKLLKLREDKRILLEKVTASEMSVKEEEAKAEKAIKKLQQKLATQVTLVETSQEQIQRYIKEMKTKEDEKSKLEKQLRSSEETGNSLNLRTVFLDTQLSDCEASLRRMEEAYSSQLLEMNELRDRLVRQTQESGWSSRMLQIAGTVVRAPRAILRTLLSTTGSALTS
ncbi:uncharacterized protein LOC143149874 isoform X2 [Ptiloglossa arizonensis]|uniref:uncharacterized protein LOC143149874 isoform X2 n=1 Tax=Ptiloglossa arizonensis TaxID=3350558 RepID=UPI003FA04217